MFKEDNSIQLENKNIEKTEKYIYLGQKIMFLLLFMLIIGTNKPRQF